MGLLFTSSNVAVIVTVLLPSVIFCAVLVNATYGSSSLMVSVNLLVAEVAGVTPLTEPIDKARVSVDSLLESLITLIVVDPDVNPLLIRIAETEPEGTVTPEAVLGIDA